MTDWSAPAKLIERIDDGSDRAFDFNERASGTLAEIVSQVASMPVSKRARVLVDAGAQGTLTVAQVIELAAREDFPA